MTSAQIYKEGGNKGIWMGVYLSALFLCAVLSDRIPLLSVVAFVLLVGIPFFSYRIIARIYKKNERKMDFTSLWLLGIMLFLCGSLICALVSYIYLQYVQPDFIYEQASKTLELYREIPQLRDSDVASLLEASIEDGLLPDAIQFAMEMLWMTVFSGSVLAFFLVLAIRWRFPEQKGR